jgi:hypothetical protein
MSNDVKKQLEEIWNSREIGWLKQQNKDSKKKEQRKIRITFYEKVTVHTIEETVWVRKKDTASSFTWDIISRHFPDRNLPSHSYEARFVYD